jgi:outer membrane protein TolC
MLGRSVASLRSQLASYEATIPQLEQKLAHSNDLLATLAGRIPAERKAPDVALTDLTLPSELPVSLPSELIRQRPDILVAEATRPCSRRQSRSRNSDPAGACET